MPIYVYVCPAGHRWEQFSSMANYKETRECPCGQTAGAEIQVPYVGGGQMTEKFKQSLMPSLKPETVRELKTVRDLERKLDEIGAKHPAMNKVRPVGNNYLP